MRESYRSIGNQSIETDKQDTKKKEKKSLKKKSNN